MAADNKTIGRFELSSIPPAPRGVPQIEVAFDLDANGILHVSAKDLGTGKEQSIKITASSGLTDAEIERMTRDAEMHAEEDKKRRELAETRNQADALVHASEKSLKDLKDKVDAGAQFLITQMFFDNRFYFDFVERARAIGIDVPIIPGVMPILSLDGIKRMTELSAAALPDGLERELEARRGDDEAVAEFGVAYATLQCAELLAAGAPGIHFITLNRSPATRAILSALKLSRPWAA